MSATLGFGVIEGFYGRPWPHASRLDMLRELAELELDTYLYAPKNDPQHRSAWFRPLGVEDRRRLAEVVDAARARGVRFVYGLAPERILGGAGNVRSRSWRRRDRDRDGLADEPFQRLAERLTELFELGLRDFVLAFDDTWATFVPALATFERGLLHARVAHRALALLRGRDRDTRVFLVPAIYHRRVEEMPRGARAYLRGLAALGAEIPIAWTGPNIFSRRIEPGDVARLERETGLPIWIWSNAIANDWLPLSTGEPLGLAAREKLSFGPPECLAPGLVDRTRGVLLNAAREPELTKVSLACLAEVKARGVAYDAPAAHERAIARVFGADGRDVGRALWALTKRHPFAAPGRFEGALLEDRARDFLAGRLPRGELERTLAELEGLEERARSVLSGTRLLDEITPTLRRTRLAAASARIALERASADRRGDRARAHQLARDLEATMAASRSIPWDAALAPLFSIASASTRDLSRGR